jgi:hypothetical protein
MILDEEENLGLRATFFGLRDVNIHFIAIEVGVIGAADLEIEAEGTIGHDAYEMGHNRHAMEGGLAIKEDNVAIAQVTFDGITLFEVFREGREISDIAEVEAAAIRADNVIGAGETFRALHDQLLHLLNIPLGDAFGNGEDASDFLGDPHFVNREVGIRRNDGPGGEIDAFAGEMTAEPAFFAFEALSESPESASRAMTGWGNARDLIIEESSDVILKEFPEIFDDEVRGARFNVFPEALINANGID